MVISHSYVSLPEGSVCIFWGGDTAKQLRIVGRRRWAMFRSTYVMVAEDRTVIKPMMIPMIPFKPY